MPTAEFCLHREDAATAEIRCGEPEDEVLVRAAQSGNRVALDALVAKYRPRVYAYAFSLLLRADDAEDATQETFLRLTRTLDSYQHRGQFRAWLYRITANLCRDCRRRNRRQSREISTEVVEEMVAGEDVHAHVTVATAVAAVLVRLPEKYREPMGLRLLEDLSPAEIAVVLGRPVNLVRVQLWRARALLVRELGDWLD
jgi:RNA polymerase sigma factor (sigma-70 family)